MVLRIQAVMDHYGLSVSAFADALGVQRSSISHLLNGRNKPSLDFVMKLIGAYPEVDLYWLLKGEGSFPKARKKEEGAVPGPVALDAVRPQAPKAPSPAPQRPPRADMAEPVNIVLLYGDGTFRAFDPKKD